MLLFYASVLEHNTEVRKDKGGGVIVKPLAVIKVYHAETHTRIRRIHEERG